MKPCPLDGTYQLARNILAAKYGIEPTEPNAVTENRPQP